MAQNKTPVRVIARLDIKGPNVVKTIHTEGLRVVGDPKDMLDRYSQSGADEIIYMDIVASLYQRSFDFEQLQKTSKNVFVPMTVGGGIRSLQDIDQALHSGADKVAINTYGIHHVEFLKQAVEKFGSQCIVLSVEAKKIEEGMWEAYTDGGREKTGRNVLEWIREAIELGVGEILLTSIDRDGTRIGYDIDLIRAVMAIATVPVIAHGGAGSLDDIVEVVTKTAVDAVSISSLLHYEVTTIGEIKSHLTETSITVRNI